LPGRVVADEQDRVGFIELSHRSAGRGGFFAQRCNQARVIGGAVMADIIRADRRARDAPQHVIFFVGGAVRTDESDRVRPRGFSNFSEPPGNFRNRVFPA